MSTDQADQANEQKRLERWRLRDHFGAKVGREIDLINHRMTWLVTSQAFLFAGWIQPELKPELARVAAIIGLGVAFFGYLSINAALRYFERMAAVYLDTVEWALKLPVTGYGRDNRWTFFCGNVPAVALPSLFGSIWMGVLYQGNPYRAPSLTASGITFIVGVFVALRMWKPWDRWQPVKDGEGGVDFCEPLQTDIVQHAAQRRR